MAANSAMDRAERRMASDYGRARDLAGFSDQRRGQDFGQELAGGQFGEARRAQDFGQGLSAAQFGLGQNISSSDADMDRSRFDLAQALSGADYDLRRAAFGNQQVNEGFGRAITSMDLADRRKAMDFNSLMAALGGSQIAVPQVGVAPYANMNMNAQIANAQNQSSSIFDVLPGIAGAYMMGAPDNSWLWG